MKTVLINGSPKKKLSVSSYLLGIVRMLVSDEVVSEHVRNQSDHKRVLKNIKDADAVVIGLPLYVDGVPSHMLAFLKEMEQFCLEHNIRVRVYALSNGGFIEGRQNKPLMQELENFCKRSNLEWCGGIGIGGIQSGNWLPMDAVQHFAKQLGIILFFNLGVFFYSLRMSIAINKGVGFAILFIHPCSRLLFCNHFNFSRRNF